MKYFRNVIIIIKEQTFSFIDDIFLLSNKSLISLKVQKHSKFNFFTLKKNKTSSEFLNVLMSLSCAGNLYVGPSKPKYNPSSSKSIPKSCPSKPNTIK